MNEYNNIEIRRLLALYYEGKTSPDNDKVLRDYFALPDTDPEFDDDKLFFEAMADSVNSTDVPPDFQQRLTAAINSWDESEQKSVGGEHRFKLIFSRRTIGIAASIAVLIALGGMILDNQSRSHEPADTFTDPVEAYAETQRVLALFANTIDKSVQGIETVERSRSKAIGLAFEQLNKI